MAARTLSSTMCTPVRFRAWTALKPIAETSRSVLEHTDLGVGQPFEAKANRFPWSGTGQTQLALASRRFDHDLGIGRADALDGAARAPARPDRSDRTGGT